MINSQQGQIWGWIMIIFCIDLVMFWFMQFVQTNMGEQMSRRIVDATGGYLKMEDIVNGTSFHTLFGIKCYTTCSFFYCDLCATITMRHFILCWDEMF